MKIDEVEPHGVDFYTSVYDHARDFESYVNDHGTGKGYEGAVKPRGVHFDIDRPDLTKAISDARKLGSTLVEDYGAPPA